MGNILSFDKRSLFETIVSYPLFWFHRERSPLFPERKKYGERFSSGGIMEEQACTGLKKYAAGCQGVRLTNSGIDQKGKIWLCGTVFWIILMRQKDFQ